MRRLALIVVAAACRPSVSDRVAPPPPPSDAAAAAPAFRTHASGFGADPKLAATGTGGMVVSEAPLATQVGRDVLAAGGNAVDAAVATAFTLAVVHPSAGNLAGGGFALVYEPAIHATGGHSHVSALDFRETAPAAATPDMFKASPPTASLVGDKASGVPGSVAGLWALHKKYGRRPWKELIAPAIAFASNGFAIDPILHAAIERRAARPGLSPAMQAIWLPGGKPAAVGEIVRNPELATVLGRIAEHGLDGFYAGETAAAIVDEMQHNGGLITAADLKAYQPVWREPLRVSYRGRELATMPPPSSGGIVVALTANLLRRTNLAWLGWHSTEHVHLLAEVWRRAYAARNELLGDPAFVPGMPIDRLLGQDYADRLAATIGPAATPSREIPALLEGNHTTNLCVVDGGELAVALTTTLNTSFGSGVMVSGFLLNNEMDDFATKPGQPNVYGLVQGTANRIEPGKRMLSSMAPTIIEQDGRLVMLAGGGGGPRIITAVWQTLSNTIDFGMSVEDSVAAPRVHHQHLPDELVLENEAITRDTDAALRALGYALVWGQLERSYAAVNAIVRTEAGWRGAADPRGGGAAMGD